MKKRLHDKKAGIAILFSLIIISLAEIIFRAVALSEFAFTTSNFGEQIAVVALAVAILILTAKGKDRACYICYGAWIGYFVLDHIFELMGTIIPLIKSIGTNDEIPFFAFVPVILRVISMITVICLGVVLVEYMNDGSIYNRAFNVLSVITVALLAFNIVASVPSVIVTKEMPILLDAFNNLYRLTMVFMFTFFAYDSAKAQLKKTDLSE